MPVMIDRCVQSMVKNALEPSWKARFEGCSYGFRPGRGCHDAIEKIYKLARPHTRRKWIVDADIQGAFDALDHELLLKTLSERIHDGRLLNLMRELLDAGYLEDWKFHQTLSGVPQGGVVSPILSNILLDKLDTYVETFLIPRYTKGDKKRANEEYAQLIKQAHYQRKQGNTQVAEQPRRQAQQLPSGDPADPNYRRLKYVRYADDFLLGFIGPRWEAEEIKQQIGEFLRDELKLELSQTKTLLTHARSEAARFLGYEITTVQKDRKRTIRDTNSKGTRTKCRSVNGRIGLRVPRDVIVEKCERYRRGQKAIHRTELTHESDYTLIMTYQLEYRGIAN
jgi:group II intron reverse transcriptase/maturase